MTFTDDDLKLLKRNYRMPVKTLKALLRRLEAAEVLAEYWIRVSEEDNKEVKAWRKVSGKERTGE